MVNIKILISSYHIHYFARTLYITPVISSPPPVDSPHPNLYTHTHTHLQDIDLDHFYIKPIHFYAAIHTVTTKNVLPFPSL
jgi:hypothetical protein